jgi:hypothetical protein
MSEILYAYAKNNNGEFVNIKDANRENFYYLESESNDKAEMIVVQGEQLQWHYRSKVKNIAIRMTAEHINLQAEISKNLSFYCQDLAITINGKKSKIEHRLSNNRIVDVAYFDENDDFLCGIEVVHTNDISDEKYKDLYESNYLIFKVYTDDPKRFIFINNSKIDRESLSEAEKRTIYSNDVRISKIENAFREYKQQWQKQMESDNKYYSGKYRTIKNEHELFKQQYKPDEDEYYKITTEYQRLIETENVIRTKLHNITSRIYKQGNYFDREKFIKSELRKIEGEEGELIRDIEEITKHINAFLTFS